MFHLKFNHIIIHLFYFDYLIQLLYLYFQFIILTFKLIQFQMKIYYSFLNQITYLMIL